MKVKGRDRLIKYSERESEREIGSVWHITNKGKSRQYLCVRKKRNKGSEQETLSWQRMVLIAKVKRGENMKCASLALAQRVWGRRLMRGEQEREMAWPLTSHPKTCKTTQLSIEWNYMSTRSGKNRLQRLNESSNESVWDSHMTGILTERFSFEWLGTPIWSQHEIRTDLILY